MAPFGFGSGFGASQPSQAPFGSAAPSPFGATQSVFGQASSSPFGGSTGGGLFGASAPAFGTPQTPAFGASSSAFGSTSFGAQPSAGGFGGFGQTPTGFGASQPAFGAASSTPAFGGAAPFGGAAASPFGGGAPAGGGFAASTPAFGGGGGGFGASSSPAFGASAFGAGGGGFGSQQGGFGMPQQQSQGTRGITYQKVPEQEGGTGANATKQQVYFCSLMALPQFRGPAEKNPLELRWEDYQMGNKGGGGAAASPGAGVFGQQQPAGGFGATPAPSGFGGGGGGVFGQASSPAFGAASTPAFGGGFGQTGSAFGASTGGLFGKPASTPAFGQSSSPFGGATPAPFGAASTPAFGATPTAFGASTPAFGAASTPAFGATGGFSSGFGAASTPSFGTPQTTAAFGGGGLFGGASASQPFGAASSGGFSFGGGGAPASSAGFSFASSTPAFGATSSPAPFGAASAGGFNFGQSASTPAFGGGGGLFGQTASKPFGSTLGSPSPFGASAPSLFGASSGGSLFGAPASSAAFGGGGLFGSTPSSGSSLFSFAQPQAAPGGQLGQQQGALQLPGVSSSPYGTLPPAPAAAEGGPQLAEYRSGISTRPFAGLASQRTLALLAPRNITPRTGVPLRPASSRARTRRIGGGIESMNGSASALEETASPGAASSLLLPRENPRQFFVRGSLPTPEAGPPSSATRDSELSPSALNGSTSGAQPASQPARSTPQDVRRGSQPQTMRANAAPVEEERSPPRGSPHRFLSDDEVGQLLPKLSGADLYIEPSLTQLAAMAREDEASLANVANFKVGHRRFGHVQWRVPVDVRRMDLDAAVAFSKNTVEVYLDRADKPPIGEGLNKPAEVVLLGVFKIDKATGARVTDPAAIDSFVRRLKRLAANQHARFIDYDATAGTWRFQVEHFSKYGLLEDSDSDEEAATVVPAAARAASGKLGMMDSSSQSEELQGMQEGDEVDSGPGGEGEEEGDALELPPATAAVQRAAASPVLPHALPALLDLDPVELASMRDSLCPPAEDSRPAKRQTIDTWRPPAATAALQAGKESREAQRQEASSAHAHTCWVKSKPALQPAAKRTWGPGGGTPAEGLPRLAAAPGMSSNADEPGALVDAGAALGASFRVGWGPSHAFWNTGKGAQISLRRLPYESSLGCSQTAEASESEASRCRELLQLLWKHSQAAPAAEGGAPVWELQCTATQLGGLCSQLLALTQKHMAQNDSGAAKAVCLKAESDTWELVSVLFAEVPSEPEAPPPAEGDLDTEDESYDDTLKQLKRRSKLSAWLREQAASRLEAGLEKEPSMLAKIAALLSAQEIPAAASLAMASGLPRLATMISQVGASPQARKDIATQLRLWQDNGLEAHMDPEMLALYRLLAGEPGPLTQLLALDWRRAFGLHLWFARTPAEPISAAMDSYLAAVAAGPAAAAPEPTPAHAEASGWAPGQRRSPDVAFGLLQLAAGRLAACNPADVSQLLSPSGYTPEPLSALHAWLLLRVLRAVGALPPAPETALQEAMLAQNVVSQLRRAGGLAEWEVFVALCLPARAPQQEAARGALLQELLHRHAPAWAEDSSKRSFLAGLGIPAEWTARALAVLSRAQRDSQEELRQLLAGQQWREAHEVLVASVAPRLLSGGRGVAELKAALSHLCAHVAELDAASWRLGGGLLATYLEVPGLEDAGENAGLDQVQEWLPVVLDLVEPIAEASRRHSRIGSSPAVSQVLAKMAARVSQWLSHYGTAGGLTEAEVELAALQLGAITPERCGPHLVRVAAVLAG